MLTQVPSLWDPSNTDHTLLYLDPKLFWQPDLEDFNGLHAPVYCFLVSHGNCHVVFDLGVRRDWHNYAPKVVSLIKATTKVTPGLDVASLLDSDPSDLGIRSSNIESVIWSHNHFDHIGNPSTFPPSTELVVGPGVKASSWPGYPCNLDASVLDSDAQGRVIREVRFDTGLKIGRFDALDFFGDGSFYLLDAPGHAIGHMCALARTTALPASFVFMGADACHHPGLLRPSEYLPLPPFITPSPFTHIPEAAVWCPGSLLRLLTPGQNPCVPFFTVSCGPLFPDHSEAMHTVQKIQELDAADNVFVVLAHDSSLRDRIPLFPKMINEWRANNLRSMTRWRFCSDFENAVQRRLLEK
uniref:Putative demethylase n=1 Tax=Cladonia uncialis subsp. uncialis TaxID=180999 RepID=A0A1Z1CE38_CLAUC|nr:putative demethylase [Cladonia uncialis subsp. uncialis]AUW31230.1 putative homoserine lactonase [Cladonia uncialis subsp. uncialis]